MKPEFFTDKKMGALGAHAALVFQSLWCSADDGGVSKCDADVVKGTMFMRWDEFTIDVIERALAALEAAKRITCYVVGDDTYAFIANFEKHQHINRPSVFRYPRPDSVKTPATHDVLSESSVSTLHPRVLSSSDPDILEDQEPTRASAREQTALAIVEHSGNGLAKHAASSSAVALFMPKQKTNAIEIKSRLGSYLDSVKSSSVEKLSKKQLRRMQAEVVFAYWVAKNNHDEQRTIMDAKRERRIVERLDENDGNVSELLFAIDGSLRDKFLNGERDGAKHLGIETVLRDRGMVEKLAESSAKYRRGELHDLAEKYEADTHTQERA